jgi:integrase
MVGKVRHLVNRSGRYHARLVVPKDLRKLIGKTELRSPLGGDYRQAIKLLPGAVTQLQHQIALAERKVGPGGIDSAPARYPLAPDQLALSHYQQRLAFDDELRNDPRYAQVSIDDMLVKRLREAIAGRASNEELQGLIGNEIERFRAVGNLDARQGSDEWRVIARAMCMAEYEALERVSERDEGDYTGMINAPMIKDAQPKGVTTQPVSLTGLWGDYLASRIKAGFMRDKGARQRPVIKSLRSFLKHDDATRLDKKDVLKWREALMQTLSAKTVNDIYLSALKSVLAWAVENDRISENVAENVRQPKPRKVYGRERGYTDTEAETLLKASRSYESSADRFGRVRESAKMASVKRWVPLICAFTGARVSEIIQLRKEDLREIGGQWVARITIDAGTVKYGGYRDVPLHQQIVSEGFMDFVAQSEPGPLFHNAVDPEKYKSASVIVSNKLSEWLRVSGLRPEGMQPNHAWRHRFKTICRELGGSDRVADAIQGHGSNTAGDDYGDVTIKTRVELISKLPAYRLR